MKKSTLAIAAMCAFGAASSVNAQETFVVDDPSVDPSVTLCNEGGIYDVFALGDAGMKKLAANPNIKVNDYRVKGEDDAANAHYPGGNAGWASDDDYAAVTVPADGRCFDGFEIHGGWYQWWSGFFIARKTDTDLSHINADSHLHMAICMVGDVALPYVDLQWFKADGNDGTAPSFTLSDDYVNNHYPVVGSLKKGEWVAVDITLGKVAEMMKDEFDIEMDYTRLVEDWQGEAVMFSLPNGQDGANEGAPDPALGDGGKAFIDGIYVYTPTGGAGVDEVTADAGDIQVVISDKTISVLGSDNAPVELYNLAGSLVKASATSVIGLEDIAAGVYVIRTLDVARKVVIR